MYIHKDKIQRTDLRVTCTEADHSGVLLHIQQVHWYITLNRKMIGLTIIIIIIIVVVVVVVVFMNIDA